MAVKPASPPTLIESDYAAKLVGFVDRIQHATQRVVQALPDLLRADGLRTDADDGRKVHRLMSHVRTEVMASTNDTAIAGLAAHYAKRTADHHRIEFAQQLEDAKWVNIAMLDRRIPGAVSQFVHENVALIRKLQGATLDHLETLLYRGISSGMGVEELGLTISERFGISERHARFIARDQIQKLDSKVTELRHFEMGITQYDWWTMLDPKVRKTHRPRHAKRFLYSDPPSGGHPGTEAGCRCRQVPFLDQSAAEQTAQADHEVWLAEQRAAQDRGRAALQAALLGGPRRAPKPRPLT